MPVDLDLRLVAELVLAATWLLLFAAWRRERRRRMAAEALLSTRLRDLVRRRT